MTTELKKAVRKKRTTSKATSLPSEGDHRKRRRNRTTQSCLNCHTSKRMCDRKRPCGRCTHLGQTSICVYEVDDPSKRTDVQDESSRLRQRVAELEGVICKLKNKPHPRWAQAISTEVKSEKQNACSQSRSAENEAISSSPSHLGSNSGPGDRSHPSPQLPSHAHPHHALAFSQIPADSTKLSAPYSPYFGGVSCPLSTPSPSIMTPIDEYTQTQSLIVGEQLFTGAFDFPSIFMSYSGSIGCGYNPEHNDLQAGGGILADHLDGTYRSEYRGHCGCLTEGPSYNVVLELSLRLRKAANILLGSGNCCLSQRISELDALVMTTLGSITTPPNDIN